MLSGRKAHRILSALAALFLINVCAGAALAQFDQAGRWENGVSEAWWFTDEPTAQDEIAAAQSRWKLIGDSNSSSEASEWAGDYFAGSDTHGSFLRWSPENGFVLMHVNKCAARVMDFSYGTVKFTPTSIQFVIEKTVKPSSLATHKPHRLSIKFLPVKWRDGHYLVEENEVGAFGDYVAGLGEYNSGLTGFWIEGMSFFAKTEVEATGSTFALPIVPPGYERFIKKPIDAKITAVGRRVVKQRLTENSDEPYYESETPVTINVGWADGVKKGMSFMVLMSGRSEEVKIRRVGRRSSTGVIVRFVKEDANTPPTLWDDEQDMDYSPIAVGWELSTSPHKLDDLQSPD